MAHVVTLVETDPNDGKKFEKLVSSMRFECSEERKKKLEEAGESEPDGIQPYPRKVQLYDITLPEENLPEFLRELSAFEGTGHISGIDKIMKWVRKLLPIKKPEFKQATVEQKKKTKEIARLNFGIDWLYVKFLGIMEDKKDKHGIERI